MPAIGKKTVVELNEAIWSRYSVRCTAVNWIAREQEKLLELYNSVK
jgi:hypothetical protein